MISRDKRCDGCPVKTQTGLKSCADTPYSYRIELLYAEDMDGEQLSMVEAEIEFLISLLPEGVDIEEAMLLN